MMPYICEGTIVKTDSGNTGRVIGVDRVNKIAVVYNGKSSFTVPTIKIKVVSYKEVM